MNNCRLLNSSERKVNSILRRRLASTYEIQPHVRLSDAIKKDEGEWLEQEEFRILHGAHLDFLVTTAITDPVLAVEFDGPSHDDPRRHADDVIKNRLCRKANLPLLRLRAPEITVHDRITLFDYVLDRFLCWEGQKGSIRNEIRAAARSLGCTYTENGMLVVNDPNRMGKVLGAALHPTFRFNAQHAFSPTQEVRYYFVME